MQFDTQTEQIIVFIDSSKIKETSSNIILDYDDAMLQAVKFIENHNLNNEILVNSLAADESECTEYNWFLTWHHNFNGIPIKDDRIEIRVNKFTGAITGFFSKWSEAQLDCEPQLSITQIEEELRKIIEPELMDYVEDTSLQYIYSRTDETLRQRPQLSYVFEFEQRCTTREIWLSAINGDFLGDEKTLSNGDVEITVVETPGVGYSDTGSRVKPRFQTNDYSTSYHYNVTKDDLLEYWDEDNLEYLYHWGHGYKHEPSLGIYPTGLVDADDEDITPIEIAQNVGFDDIKFIFICSCHSGFYQDEARLDQNLARMFTDGKEVDAYMGWEGTVVAFDAHWFTRVFYNYVFDEYSIGVAEFAADLIVGPNTNCLIYGDDDLVLSVTLDVDDASPGENLGSASSSSELTVWHYDEPIWHPDQDWFYFTVIGEHSVNVWVIPEQDDFDVAFILYKSGSYVSRNCQGPGGSEFYSFTHSSGEFLYRVRVDAFDGHGYGGSYDIRIQITLIS